MIIIQGPQKWVKFQNLLCYFLVMDKVVDGRSQNKLLLRCTWHRHSTPPQRTSAVFYTTGNVCDINHQQPAWNPCSQLCLVPAINALSSLCTLIMHTTGSFLSAMSPCLFLFLVTSFPQVYPLSFPTLAPRWKGTFCVLNSVFVL